MQCSKCRNGSIIYQPYSGQYLCRDHFINDLEAKAKREIRVHQGMKPGDVIGVPQSGDAAGRALLFFLQKLTGNRRDIRVLAVMCNGGCTGYREVAGTHAVTKIALATTLEDAAASALTDILQGHVARYLSPLNDSVGTVPLVAPFRHIPADEVATYARVCGIPGEMHACRPGNDPLHAEVAVMLTAYSRRHPATSHAVLNFCESLVQTCRNTSGDSTHGA